MAEGRRMTAAQAVDKLMGGEHADVIRESVRLVVAELMEAEVAELVGAELGERAPERRTTHRNGYRERTWDTRVGELELQIPRLRSGPAYFPSFLEPRRRAEQALVAVVQEAYVNGVSTRTVDRVVEQFGVRMTKDQVSRLCRQLDCPRNPWPPFNSRNGTLGHSGPGNRATSTGKRKRNANEVTALAARGHVSPAITSYTTKRDLTSGSSRAFSRGAEVEQRRPTRAQPHRRRRGQASRRRRFRPRPRPSVRAPRPHALPRGARAPAAARLLLVGRVGWDRSCVASCPPNVGGMPSPATLAEPLEIRRSRVMAHAQADERCRTPPTPAPAIPNSSPPDTAARSTT
jgi:hypothetical protein